MPELPIYIFFFLLLGLLIGYLAAHLLSKTRINSIADRLKSVQSERENLLSTNEHLKTQFDTERNTKEEHKSQLAVSQSEIQHLSVQLENLNTEFKQERDLLNRSTEEKDNLSSKLAVAENEVLALHNKLKQYQEDVVKMEERFENLANKIFEEKTKVLKTQNKDQLKDVLDPLKDKIVSFEKRVNDIHKDSVEQNSSLRQELKHLQELNQKVSQEANNLTNALKKDSKMQGNWGELVLEKVLEKSGLEKGREYDTQPHLVDEEGNRFHPDVIVHLPDQSEMVIDSKVSLVAYEKMINAENDEEKNTYLKDHLLSVRNHVNSLGNKSYHRLIERGPDFVLMFIPIETAFAIATSYDNQLYNDAFEKNIVIVTPSTLLATLKTIDARWQNEKQHKNALEIAGEAGKMYDKFETLLQDLKKLGTQMDTSKKTYEASMNKLSDGSGNLIRRAEKIKKLGAKANKQIEKEWINRAQPDLPLLDEKE